MGIWWKTLAEQQHGLVTWSQGVEAVGEDRVEADARAGRISRIRPCVYVVTGAPATREQALLAACLSTGATASHRSAAWLQRWPGAVSLRPEITTSPSTRVRLSGVRAHRSTYLPAEHITVVDGIPCTTPVRTAVDISAVYGDDTVKRMINRGHDAGLFTYADVVTVFNEVRRRGRRRVAHLAPILDECLAVGEKSKSDGERWVMATIRKSGLRVPKQQVWVVVNGRRFCIDVAYLPEKVGIEFQGMWAHADRRTAVAEDADKISELELAGWLMLPVTHQTTASVLINRVQRALAQRAPTSGHSPAISQVSVQKSELWVPGYGSGRG